MTRINKDQSYAVVRYFKNMRPRVMKTNLSIEEAREMCAEYPTKRIRGSFNSFVGFTHMSNL